MILKRFVCFASLTVTSALSLAATAQQHDHGTAHHAASNSPAPSAAPAGDQLVAQTVHVDDRFESTLDTGCTYEVTIRGSVSPVRDNRNANATTQRLRPDLRVAATVRCPQSTESHIQERRVASTGVTREELERLVELNATVHRMQNSGRCLYVPAVGFSSAGFASAQVDYLCPHSSSHVRATAHPH